VFGSAQLWIAATQWLDRTPWGRLQKIVVCGLERLPESDILVAAELPFGVSLMHFPYDSIAAKITALLAVKHTRILRRLPGRLIIRVEERRPVASVCIYEIALIDVEGVVFPIVETGEVIDLPMISIDIPYASEELFDSKMLKALGLIIQIMEDYPVLYDHLSEVVANKRELKLRLREGGAEVRTRGKIDQTVLRMLEEFLKQKSSDLPADLKYVDVSFEKKVVTGRG